MKNFKFIFTIFILMVLTGSSFSQPFELVNAFPNVSFSAPLYVTHSNDGTNRVFVIQKAGIIRVLQNDSTTSVAENYLNITDRVNGTASERGLLGLAFHPNYASNGYLYVDYTRSDGATVISRFTRNASNPNKADSTSELILLTISQPFSNHNGGIVFFGLDGYLYIGMGDGGSAGDPGNRAQNTNELLGKILRINVDSSSGGNNYAIPPSNPFAAGGGRAEIFTTGMRNPWRVSQDPVTGIIYCGDVGQGAWEEVDIIEVGKNYGWRCYEGNSAYNTSGCGPITDYTFPIKEYSHSLGISITGGFVYRGLRRPELTGRYIYADYGSRRVWKLKYENGVVSEDELILTAPSNVYSFGTDQNNELYVCSSNNVIYRFNKSDLVGINNNVSAIPDGFKLEQNYPNPFNPETNIKYYIPELAKVNLSIYDALGKEINSLVNTNQLPGEYQIRWNGKDAFGNNIPSGAYFYKLTAGNNFSETKRMIMLK